ncbi:BTAD domain-containing putative transcriptional regulator [Nonomuraea maheshkhaliensis]|uniref:BTAD domain-containing putative transcriptional regulator n=1 Tax=Nonomuraea maheshkhaliensis TaxID=419590 RepID=A0ABN2FDZ3_9ACTN
MGIGRGLRFSVLGPLRVAGGDGPITISAGKQRVVLATLLLHAGQEISYDQLTDRVWDLNAPDDPRSALFIHVTRLRRVLGDRGEEPRLIRTHGHGYAIDVEDDCLDLTRFRRLARRAERAAGEGDLSGEADLLEQALGLWQEPVLGNVPSEVVHRDDVPQLVEERMRTLERWFDVSLTLGRHGQIVGELLAAADAHPLREGLRARLMVALYRSGRQAEALKAYQDLATLLREELGVDPGKEVRALRQAILNDDAELAAPGTAGQRVHARVVPRQLPAPPAPFVGRHDELERLDDARAAGGPVVISAIAGGGGMGKTWLALHWAHRNLDRFPDGQLFVDLRGFSPDETPMAPEVAVRGFLHALGVAPGQVPDQPHAQASLFRSLVATRRMLLVLDNAVDAAQVAPLLPGGGTCVVVVTSRRWLSGVTTRHGARHLALDTLSDDEAHALLTRRIGAARVAAETAAVTEFVALCKGLPLALSIIAARAAAQPRRSLMELVAELRDEGLGALDDDDPSASLPAVLSWSLRALPAEQARVLALLAIAPGPDLGPYAAADLTGLPLGRTRTVLRQLEQASLLSRDEHARYRMHDLVRRYAAERGPADTAALRRVVGFYLRTMRTVDMVVHPAAPVVELDPPATGADPAPPHDMAAALSWFDSEYQCLLAAQKTAADHGMHVPVWAMAWYLNNYQERRGLLRDQLDVVQAGLDAAVHLGDPAAEARMRRLLGNVSAKLGRYDQAMEHLTHALTLARETGDRLAEARAYRAIAVVWMHREDYEPALDQVTRAQQIFHALDDPVAEGDALNDMSWYAAKLGRYDVARETGEAALLLARRTGSPSVEGTTLDTLGYVNHLSGDHARAVQHYRDALRIQTEIGSHYFAANTLVRLGDAYAMLGDHDEARAAWQRALSMYQQQGRAQDVARVRRLLGPDQSR